MSGGFRRRVDEALWGPVSESQVARSHTDNSEAGRCGRRRAARLIVPIRAKEPVGKGWVARPGT